MVAPGFLLLGIHPRMFVEPTPLTAAQVVLAVLLSGDGLSC